MQEQDQIIKYHIVSINVHLHPCGVGLALVRDMPKLTPSTSSTVFGSPLRYVKYMWAGEPGILDLMMLLPRKNEQCKKYGRCRVAPRESPVLPNLSMMLRLFCLHSHLLTFWPVELDSFIMNGTYNGRQCHTHLGKVVKEPLTF